MGCPLEDGISKPGVYPPVPGRAQGSLDGQLSSTGWLRTLASKFHVNERYFICMKGISHSPKYAHHDDQLPFPAHSASPTAPYSALGCFLCR